MRNRLIKYLMITGLSLGTLSAYAQSTTVPYGWDFVNHRFFYPSFGGYVNNNTIQSLCYDDSIIVTNVQSLGVENDTTYYYTSWIVIHDIYGNQIKEKQLKFPFPYDKSQNLGPYQKTTRKIGKNRFITGGWNFDFIRVPGFNISSSFWYIFDQNGDSIRFGNYEETADNHALLETITVSHQEIIIGIRLEGDNGGLPPYIGDFRGNKCRLIKLNNNGDIIWNKIIDSTYTPYVGSHIMSLEASPKGDYYYIFQTRRGELPRLIVIDSSGNYLFHKEIAHTNDFLANAPESALLDFNYIRGTVSTSGGLYYLKKDCKPFQLPSGDTSYYTGVIHYGKLDALGDTVWRKTYDIEPGAGIDMFITQMQIQAGLNGDLHIVAPYSYYDGSQDQKTIYLVTDSNGVVKLARNYRRFNESYTNYHLKSIEVGKHGKVVMGGGIHFPTLSPSSITDSMRLRLNGRNASWLIMVDSLGRRCEGDTVLWDHVPDCLVQPGVLGIEQTAPSTIGVAIYPNPVSESLTIALDILRGDDKLQLSIVDMQGRVIHQRVLTHLQTTIDCSQLATGMYAIQIYDATGIRYSGKVVKR